MDFRKSVDGLTAIVQLELMRDPMKPGCYVFCNKQNNRIKIIEWDFNGFWMHFKRLESGKFQWPHPTQEVLPIYRALNDWLMNGLKIYKR